MAFWLGDGLWTCFTHIGSGFFRPTASPRPHSEPPGRLGQFRAAESGAASGAYRATAGGPWQRQVEWLNHEELVWIVTLWLFTLWWFNIAIENDHV